ncbi:hypothetical protein CCY99_00240 [Helicobacter sp. 16-1353]|uniref:hypothetical protein n=1 Tax=Helicobacter sp. 16-1353 TaxID=2004996 RepID=UPI000DCE7E87|nr:hypothetical protein [Helicobacter sp. 16-1353]RAX55163.1 hypothetical protein CCY99_00240 [Helicobacter sp. 16-1353]
MYQISYFFLFYIIGIVLFVIMLGILFLCGFFNKNMEKAEPKTTLDFLLEQVNNSHNDKEILDSVMREFYANFYNISNTNKNFDKWLNLIQAITLLDYMSVEQAARFRDDLVKKNPKIKSDIEHSIGVSLKYRENKKIKR